MLHWFRFASFIAIEFCMSSLSLSEQKATSSQIDCEDYVNLESAELQADRMDRSQFSALFAQLLYFEHRAFPGLLFAMKLATG